MGYLKGRARRELGKLSPETLDQYLRGLAGLMEAIRTGKDYADFTEMAEKLPQEVGAGK